MTKYKDIDLSFSKNSFTNDINSVQDSTAIKQSIKNIILMMKGEKSFDYDYGASVQSLIFSNPTDINISALNDIDSSLRANESRITLKRVYFDNDSVIPGLVIDYEYLLETGQVLTESTTVTIS